MNEAIQNPLGDPLARLTAEIPDTNTLVWLLFFLILLYTLIHASVFVFHWYKYNIAPQKFVNLTYIIYFVGVGVFMLGLLLSTFAITS